MEELHPDWTGMAPVLVFCFDDSGIITFVNDEFLRTLMYRKEDVVKQSINVAIPVSTKIFYNTHFFPLLKLHGEAREVFMFFTNKDNQQVPLLVNARRMTISGAAVNVCSAMVVHQRQQFEEQLIAARKAVEQAMQDNTQLREARGHLKESTEQLERSLQNSERQHRDLAQFNRIVTHEFQEPLRKIFFYSDLLKQEGGATGRPADLLAKVLNAAGKLNMLVSGLQEFAWLSDKEVQYENVSLLQIVSAVQEQLHTRNDPQPLEISAGDLPEIYADREMMFRLFFILAENAVKTSKQGVINNLQIDAAVVQRNKYRQLQDRYLYENFWKIEVRDHGTGFDASRLETLFHLFPKTEESATLGVGLALCNKIVEKHQGFMEVNS